MDWDRILIGPETGKSDAPELTAADWDINVSKHEDEVHQGAGEGVDKAVVESANEGANGSANEGANEGAGLGANEGNANDGACYNCGEIGHMSRECDKPKKLTGACFNCGETGHNKADCPKPRVFTGTCRLCKEPNHMAADCPTRPPLICKNCKKEGHIAAECTNDRADYLVDAADMTPEVAWTKLIAADAEKDLDQVREAVRTYAKAVPNATLPHLEKAFRGQKLNVHLIALDVEVSKLHTLVNLQGKINCKYQVQFAWSAMPKRMSTASGWPTSPEENMARLEDAGFVEQRGVMKCNNCEGLGHSTRACKEERNAATGPRVKCFNCGEEGHRVRDCTRERVMFLVCRKCKKPGHRAVDCDEEDNAEELECRRCKEMGHFAKDCPNSQDRDRSCRNCGKEGHFAKECDEPRTNANVTCRNCDEVGHLSRDCPNPRDYSRVTCANCGKKGHTIKRCSELKTGTEAAEEADRAGIWGGPATSAPESLGW